PKELHREHLRRPRARRLAVALVEPPDQPKRGMEAPRDRKPSKASKPEEAASPGLERGDLRPLHLVVRGQPLLRLAPPDPREPRSGALHDLLREQQAARQARTFLRAEQHRPPD